MTVMLFDASGHTVDTKILGTLCETQEMPEDPLPPFSKNPHIRINEIFPDPDTSQDAGEYIELFNPNDTPVNLAGWSLTDATKTGRYIFPSGNTLLPQGYFLLTDSVFSFSLNNSKETISLFDAAGQLVDTTTYTKTTEGSSLNWTEAGWRMSKILTPLAPNIMSNTLPSTKERVPKKGYRSFPITFQAKGKDRDGDRLKYVWDFGDGHKSSLATTSHRYKKSGTYTVTLTTKDGSEEIHETFSIKIKKFDPPKLRITELFPNPEGADTAPGAEWILIKNHSDKEVDLMGYSLASGTKKLTNHPIRTNFVIPKKSARRLTREHALFSLPNQKGKVELRGPDGKPIHTLKYNFPSSLASNTLLQKEKGKPLIHIPPPPTPPLDSPEEAPKETLIPPPTLISEGVSDDSTLPSSAANDTISPPKTRPLSYARELLLRTALGTSVTLAEELPLSLLQAPEVEQENMLTASPHYMKVFLADLSTQTNTKLHTLFALDQQGE
jgi:PKD repeat protein